MYRMITSLANSFRLQHNLWQQGNRAFWRPKAETCYCAGIDSQTPDIAA